MWLESLLEKLTCFFPRMLIVAPNEAGFRQTPKLWAGWPWDYWPWIRLGWFFSGSVPIDEILETKSWYRIYCPALPEGKPWSSKDAGESTWVKEMRPGNWYWLIPLIMEHMVTPIKVQPKDIRIQSVWTKDGKDLALGGAIIYYVREPLKAILEVDNYDESIQIIALAEIRKWVGLHTLDELREGMEDLSKKLLTAVREGSAGWGLKIQSVEITDIGVTRNIRLLTNGESVLG
jgi:hypothetical protein